MAISAFHPHVVSVTEAASRGVPGLVKDAERGEDIVVERRGQPVAALVSMRHLEELRRLEADLRETAFILARVATDSGNRTELNDVITALGFERLDLEAELDAEQAAGQG